MKNEETTNLHTSLVTTLNSLTLSQNLGGIEMITEAGSKSTIQVDSAKSAGMGKAVDASGHLGRPSFGLSGLGRLAEILSSKEN